MSGRLCKVMDCAVAPGAVELRFRGQWLKSWGFHRGMVVEVRSVGAGIMELKVVGPAKLTDSDFQAAIEGLERLGL